MVLTRSTSSQVMVELHPQEEAELARLLDPAVAQAVVDRRQDLTLAIRQPDPQGHFTGEEDGLFLPAEDLLSAETLAETAERMAAIEQGEMS